MKEESKPVPLSPVEETKIWMEIINNIGGEIEIQNKDFVLDMLKSNYNITKKNNK